MPLPIAANTTCDIYRSTNSPPAAPDVAAVSIHLKPDFRQGHEATEPRDVGTWTHTALMDKAVDIRDAWSHTGPGGTEDNLYVPDKNGTGFKVIFIERVQRGQPGDHKRVFLRRLPPTWPTNEL